jgi:hypothetical protein
MQAGAGIHRDCNAERFSDLLSRYSQVNSRLGTAVSSAAALASAVID